MSESQQGAVATVENGEVVDNGLAAEALSARVAEILALPVSERSSLIDTYALTLESVSSGATTRLDMATTLAVVQAMNVMHEDMGRSVTYQRTLAYAVAERELIGKDRPFATQKDFVVRGLGMKEKSAYGSTLKQLAAAVTTLGVVDGSPEWRYLVQNSDSRKAIADAVKGAGDKPLPKGQVRALESGLRKAIKVDPTGKQKVDPKTGKVVAKVPAKRNTVTTDTGGAKATDNADTARRACEAAMGTLTDNLAKCSTVEVNALAARWDALLASVRAAEAEVQVARNSNREARTGRATS